MNYYLPYYNYKKNKYYLFDYETKKNIESFNLFHSFEECFYLSNYYSFNYLNEDGSLTPSHTHDFISLINKLYDYPNTIIFTEEDKKYLSKQELEYISFIKETLITFGIKDFCVSKKRQEIIDRFNKSYDKKGFLNKLLCNLYDKQDRKELQKDLLRHATGLSNPKSDSILLIPYKNYQSGRYMVPNDKYEYDNFSRAFDAMMGLKLEYLYEYKSSIDNKTTITSVHYFEDVIKELYLYPESFKINKKFNMCYSKQELQYLKSLQKRLQQCQLKDFVLPMDIIQKNNDIKKIKRMARKINKYKDKDMQDRACHKNLYLEELKNE